MDVGPSCDEQKWGCGAALATSPLPSPLADPAKALRVAAERIGLSLPDVQVLGSAVAKGAAAAAAEQKEEHIENGAGAMPPRRVRKIVRPHPVESHNVLLLGQSRMGKTTFRRSLTNPGYLTQMEVWRGTKNPESEVMLFELDDGSYANLVLIDTPGFGEAAREGSRTDLEIRNMIADFVKRDITKLSLILVVVDASHGLNQAQVQYLSHCLQMLGSQVASKTCILVTHFENKSKEDEEKWIQMFTDNEEMLFLSEACKGGFLFTGALDASQFKIVSLRDSFLLEQRRRVGEMFNKMLDGEPVSLMSSEMAEASSFIAMQESILTSCMSLKALLPDVRKTHKSLYELRLSMSNAIDKNANLKKNPQLLEATKIMVQKLAILDADPEHDMDKLKLEDGVEDMMKQYSSIGDQVIDRYEQAHKLNNTFASLFNSASNLCHRLIYHKCLPR